MERVVDQNGMRMRIKVGNELLEVEELIEPVFQGPTDPARVHVSLSDVTPEMLADWRSWKVGRTGRVKKLTIDGGEIVLVVREATARQATAN